MNLQECVYRVLVVSASEKFNVSMRQLMPENRFSPFVTVGSCSAAKRALLERDFDLMLINAPLPDDLGTRLASSCAWEHNIGVLIFVRGELYDEVSLSLMQSGVLTLAKPASSLTVLQSIRLLCATHERLHMLQKKNATLEDKLAEIRLVNRAKWVLIRERSMAEEEAHRYIEKLAMDRCIPKGDAAKLIIFGTT